VGVVVVVVEPCFDWTGVVVVVVVVPDSGRGVLVVGVSENGGGR